MLKSLQTLKNNWGVGLLYFSVFIVSSVTRFLNLSSIKTLVFDEKYYVKDGYSILKYGYERQWIPNYEDTGEEYWEALMDINTSQFVNGEYIIASTEYWSGHPPLGKILVALGMFFAGTDSPLGWRVSVAVAGVIVVLLTMMLAYILFRKHSVAIISGLLVGVDGLMVSMSRISYLDMFLTMFILASTIMGVLFYKTASNKYLYSASVLAGLAMGVKWSSFYFILVGLSALVIYELVSRNIIFKEAIRPLIKYLIAGFISVASYLLTWLIWLSSYGVQKSGSLMGGFNLLYDTHLDRLTVLKNASSTVFNNTNFLEWMMVSRPSFLYYEYINEGLAKIIITMPNLVIWFASVTALGISAVRAFAVKKANRNIIPLLIVFTSLWLPWIFQSDRVTFQYYAVTFAPYLYIILSYYIVVFSNLKLNRTIKQTAIFIWVVLSVLWTVFMFNINTGLSNVNPSANIGFTEVWYEIMDDSIFYDTSQDGYEERLTF